MVGFVDGEKDANWWRDEVIKEWMLEQRGNVMELRPPAVQVNRWTLKSTRLIMTCQGCEGGERGRERRAVEKDGTANRKNALCLAPDWVIRFRSWPVCVCVFVSSYHSLWVGGVLLGLRIWWTAHQWAASIWRVWWKEVSRGGRGLVVTAREMEDSIRHAISQWGTPVCRDRLGQYISLQYPHRKDIMPEG